MQQTLGGHPIRSRTKRTQNLYQDGDPKPTRPNQKDLKCDASSPKPQSGSSSSPPSYSSHSIPHKNPKPHTIPKTVTSANKKKKPAAIAHTTPSPNPAPNSSHHRS